MSNFINIKDMNKNKSILKLFAVVVLFIVYSCAKNSETIKIHTDEYNIIANVIQSAAYIKPVMIDF